MSDSDENVHELENDHEPEESQEPRDDLNDTQSITDEEEANSDGVFDRDLPTIHKYLGKLDNVSGYTLFDEGEVMSMLGIHTSTLVFPGFTLPLVMQSYYENSVMETFLETKNIFVLVCANETYSDLFNYGVTMEIFETINKNGILWLKAKGRQRCKIVPSPDSRQLAGRLQKLKVKILGEPHVGSPLDNTMLWSLKKRRHSYEKDFDCMMKHYKDRRYHLAQYPLCSWIYDCSEITYYVKSIIKGLSLFYVEDDLPTDPVTLSYWFVQNFQLTHAERLKIMQQNTSWERLRLELVYLKMERVICCGHCKIDVAQQADVIAMSKDGVQSNYCNPGGHVYEAVTVSKAKNFILIGESSKQFSWFPGYAWTIMQCNVCNCHLGWKFTSRHLQPSCFYGLAKSGFDIKIVKSSGETD